MSSTTSRRAELLLLPQYAASDDFLTAGKWAGEKNYVLSANNDEHENAMEPLYCVVVGVISSDKAFLGKHGAYNPKFNSKVTKAKLQFTVIRPDDPEFGPDFDKAIIAFEEYQRRASETPRHLFFLEPRPAMRLNFPLFEPKGEDDDRERDKESLAYSVGQEFESLWTRAKTSHHCCVMPVFGTNGLPIKPDLFPDKLIGAMCEITFTLRHYTMGPQTKEGVRVEAHDLFSANVEWISVLKSPPVIVQSPFKGRNKRPQHKPQIPTRREQVVSQASVGSTSTVHQTVAANTEATLVTHGEPSSSTTVSGDGTTLSLAPTRVVDETPIDAVTTVESINASVATGSNSRSIVIASTSATSKRSEALESINADTSATQGPPAKKRKH